MAGQDATLTELNEDMARFINHIQSSGDYMLKLVNELLSVAMIQSGSLNVDFKSTNLLHLIAVTSA
jgi:signal transduction histidine kinase